MMRAGPSADLAWLIEVLWGGVEGVDFSLGNVPEGRAPLETYRLVPGRRAPRLLLPTDPKMAWAAARAARATRSPRTSWQRTLAGLVARSGLAPLILRNELTVHARAGAQVRGPAAALSDAVGEPAALAVNVRPPGPYRKPVIQVVGGGGRVLAYAKVSWNDLTEANVEAEAEALALVAGADIRLRAPAVRGRILWKGRTVLLTVPMPPDLRRFRRGSPPPAPSIVMALASVGGVEDSSLSKGPILARLVSRWQGASRAGALPEVATALKRLLDALGTRSDLVPVGRWHGDWSSWNLGTGGDAWWAWDWEYSRTGVPVGLDLPHFHFQEAFIAQRRDLAVGVGPIKNGTANPTETPASHTHAAGRPPHG